jgi:hypothetical protein
MKNNLRKALFLLLLAFSMPMQPAVSAASCDNNNEISVASSTHREGFFGSCRKLRLTAKTIALSCFFSLVIGAEGVDAQVAGGQCIKFKEAEGQPTVAVPSFERFQDVKTFIYPQALCNDTVQHRDLIPRFDLKRLYNLIGWSKLAHGKDLDPSFDTSFKLPAGESLTERDKSVLKSTLQIASKAFFERFPNQMCSQVTAVDQCANADDCEGCTNEVTQERCVEANAAQKLNLALTIVSNTTDNGDTLNTFIFLPYGMRYTPGMNLTTIFNGTRNETIKDLRVRPQDIVAMCGHQSFDAATIADKFFQTNGLSIVGYYVVSWPDLRIGIKNKVNALSLDDLLSLAEVIDTILARDAELPEGQQGQAAATVDGQMLASAPAKMTKWEAELYRRLYAVVREIYNARPVKVDLYYCDDTCRIYPEEIGPIGGTVTPSQSHTPTEKPTITQEAAYKKPPTPTKTEEVVEEEDETITPSAQAAGTPTVSPSNTKPEGCRYRSKTVIVPRKFRPKS